MGQFFTKKDGVWVCNFCGYESSMRLFMYKHFKTCKKKPQEIDRIGR